MRPTSTFWRTTIGAHPWRRRRAGRTLRSRLLTIFAFTAVAFAAISFARTAPAIEIREWTVRWADTRQKIAGMAPATARKEFARPEKTRPPRLVVAPDDRGLWSVDAAARIVSQRPPATGRVDGRHAAPRGVRLP